MKPDDRSSSPVLRLYLLHHLASDGAGLLGGEGAVVALAQGDAHLTRGLHLELVHGGLGLGDHDLAAGIVVAGHNRIISFSF